eukprot:Nitzschia sp. Nitz4//scaffold201_size42423//25606//27042//NITZ4_007376-RA/size42423-processed-gene-0.23-mRNA-1//-1//CDS//3329541338//7820//frame0
MKNQVAITAVALSTCLSSQHFVAAEVGDLVWEDSFSSGSLDTNIWNYDTGRGTDGWGNWEMQTYTSSTDNVKVQNDKLKIKAIRNADDSGFTSGRINTANKMLFMYGRLEASIKVPDVADGLWPGFWTLGYNYAEVDWPASGEIDIMEVGQGLAITEGVVNQRVVSGAHWEHEGGYATYATSYDTSYNLYEDFRNYTMDWTPEYIATYVDGEKIFEIDISSQNCVDCTEFHHPHFVVLNLAVGGYFTSVGGDGSSGSSSSSSSCGSSASSSSGSSGGCGDLRTEVTAPLPATMKVEYVRLYDNGHTELVAPVDDDTVVVTEAPAGNKVLEPTAQPSKAPAPDVVFSFPTASPTKDTVSLAPAADDCIVEDDDSTSSSSKSASKSGKSRRRTRERGQSRRSGRRLCSDVASTSSPASSSKSKSKGKSAKSSTSAPTSSSLSTSAVNRASALNAQSSAPRSSISMVGVLGMVLAVTSLWL